MAVAWTDDAGKRRDAIGDRGSWRKSEPMVIRTNGKRKGKAFADRLRPQPTSTACTMVRPIRNTACEAYGMEGKNRIGRERGLDNVAIFAVLQEHSPLYLYPLRATTSPLLPVLVSVFCARIAVLKFESGLQRLVGLSCLAHGFRS